MPLPNDHPPILPPRTGVLLLNLGTPDTADYWGVRRYLAEFLSDARVIDAPRWFWLPLLHGIILTTRPFRSAHAYQQIWNTERNESPLKTNTRAIAEKLKQAFEKTRGAQTGATTQRQRSEEVSVSEGGATAPPVRDSEPQEFIIEWGMRYGNPSTKSAVDSLVAQGCTRIIALALYPQYSATTTATAYEKLFEALLPLKRQPSITTLGPYHDHPLYIAALAESIRSSLSRWERAGGEGSLLEQSVPSSPHPTPLPTGEGMPDAIVASFHGLPKRYLTEGDPYHCYCQKTSRLLREALGWPADQWHTSFQSRFGPAKWLEPYTSDTLLKLAAEGKKHIALISPGFASDCLETLEELNIGLREQFLAAGGESLTYIPCLNDADSHITLLKTLITQAT